MEFNSVTLIAALPEYIALFVILLLITFAAFFNDNQSFLKISRILSLITYFVIFVVLWSLPSEKLEIFNGYFILDSFRIYMKSLVILGAFFCSWLLSEGWGDEIDKIEFHTLIMFSVFGMLLMISSNDLISLYMSIEMQSLPLYVIAAMRTTSLKSSEAGLKYFLLGALSSGLLLYGCSLIYGFSGSTNFNIISNYVSSNNSIGIIVGMVFILSGVAFKISAAPFHMWTPDVFEGAPTQVTAIFAIIPKVASITLILVLTHLIFFKMYKEWLQIIMVLSIASMIIGITGAIMQQNIKRMLAYSSISHIGYALTGVLAGTSSGMTSVIIYMTIYVFMSAGAFSIIMSLRKDGALIEKISDFSGLSLTHPLLASSMMVIMFSMAGIPPLAGFFAKWYVFSAVINSGYVILAVVGVLSSVIGAFYYLRIIKLMFFDESDVPLDAGYNNNNRFITIISLLFIILFFLIIGPLHQLVVDFVNNILLVN